LVFVPQNPDTDKCFLTEPKISKNLGFPTMSDIEFKDDVKNNGIGILERDTLKLDFPISAESLEPLTLENNKLDVRPETTDDLVSPVEVGVRTRPSIAFSNAVASVLELGPGFIGLQDLSLSGLHCKRTPNPQCCEQFYNYSLSEAESK